MFGTLLSLFLACSSGASPSARVCSCVWGYGRANAKAMVKAALPRTDAVFIGSVLSVTDRTWPLPTRPSMIVRTLKVVLIVDRAWKGVLTDSVVIWTGTGPGDCGYPFQVNERYLVFAAAADSGAFSTSICTLTQPLAAASEYVRGLGEATIHVQHDSDSRRP